MDMIGLCETWLKPNVFLPLDEASTHKFTYSLAARATKQVGVAVIFTSIFNLNSKINVIHLRLFLINYLPVPCRGLSQANLVIVSKFLLFTLTRSHYWRLQYSLK